MKEKKLKGPKNDPHLGGHGFSTHIDLGILNFFKSEYKCKSYLDIGCGLGGMVYEANKLGYDVLGIDGDYRLKRDNPEFFKLCDFTKETPVINKNYDLGYSCEFVEHVQEKYLDNYMKVFQKSKIVCMTFAPEGTPGYHHVNCKNTDYWIDIFQKYSFYYDEKLTKNIRQVSSMKRDFFRKNGLGFVCK